MVTALKLLKGWDLTLSLQGEAIWLLWVMERETSTLDNSSISTTSKLVKDTTIAFHQTHSTLWCKWTPTTLTQSTATITTEYHFIFQLTLNLITVFSSLQILRSVFLRLLKASVPYPDCLLLLKFAFHHAS